MSIISTVSGIAIRVAHKMVIQGNDLLTGQSYQDEAQGIIDGMDASGTNSGNLNATDILVSNTFLDLENLLGKDGGLGCSGLMSWGMPLKSTFYRLQYTETAIPPIITIRSSGQERD